MSRRSLPFSMLLVLCGSLHFVSPSTAQTDSSIRWMVTVDKSLEGDQPGERVIFGPQEELLLNLGLNNAAGPAVSGPLTLSEHLRVTISRKEGSFPVRLKISVVDPAGAILAEHGTVHVEFSTQRQDGAPFSVGTYTVETDLSSFFGSLQFVNGSRWVGRAKTSDVRTVVVKAVVSLQDQVHFYDLEGNYHLGRGHYAEAIRNLERLVVLTPDRWQSHAALGAAYIRSGRYREAAASLERALPGWLLFPERRGDIVANDLARAYVALGQDADAARVLRSAGVGQADIQSRIERMKAK